MIFPLVQILLLIILLSSLTCQGSQEIQTSLPHNCAANNVVSGFYIKGPVNGQLVSKIVNIEVTLQVYGMDQFQSVKNNLVICVSDNVTARVSCIDDGEILAEKKYILTKKEPQTLNVQLCMKEESKPNVCFCASSVEVIPEYEISCISNIFLTMPWSDTSYYNFKYKEVNIDIYFPLVEVDLSKGLLTPERLASTQSIIESVKFFKEIVANEDSHNIYSVSMNIVLSTKVPNAASVSNESLQTFVRYVETILFNKSVSYVDYVFLFQCPEGIEDCIIPTITDNNRQGIYTSEDDVVIVMDVDNRIYEPEAVHDMVDSVLESEACFSFFSTDSVNVNYLIGEGSLYHFTVAKSRRPTRWSELPSIQSPLLDEARDFSCKHETLAYFNNILDSQSAHSVQNLLQYSFSVNNKYGQRMASFVYPWPSSAHKLRGG